MALSSKPANTTDKTAEIFSTISKKLLTPVLEVLEHKDHTSFSMRGINFAGAFFPSCSFTKADLSYADLSGASLTNSLLRKTNLSHANLSKTNLSKADLADANLSGANLSNANLSEAYIGDCNLFETNLQETSLEKARSFIYQKATCQKDLKALLSLHPILIEVAAKQIASWALEERFGINYGTKKFRLDEYLNLLDIAISYFELEKDPNIKILENAREQIRSGTREIKRGFSFWDDHMDTSEDEEYDYSLGSDDEALDENNSEETTLIQPAKTGFSSSKSLIFSNSTTVTTQEKDDIELSFSEWDSAEKVIQVINDPDMDSDAINTLIQDNGDLKFVVILTKEQYELLQSKEYRIK